MRIGDIHNWVSFSRFATTGGIASAVIVAILVFNRSPLGYSRQVRSIVSAIAALGFGPCIVGGFDDGSLVIPAALPLFSGLVGQVKLSEALRYGFVPWFIIYVLVYEIWKRCVRQRNRKSEVD